MLDPRHAALWGWGTPEIYAKMCIEEAAIVDVPVSFHLDHCMDLRTYPPSDSAAFSGAIPAATEAVKAARML